MNIHGLDAAMQRKAELAVRIAEARAESLRELERARAISDFWEAEKEREREKLLEERKAHEATRQARILAEAQLEYAMARLVSPARAEIAEAIADFWEAEAARGAAGYLASGTDEWIWRDWDGATGIPSAAYVLDVDGGLSPRSVPRLVWWHAHRRTR